MSLDLYLSTYDALGERMAVLMTEYRGHLAPTSPAWRNVLQLAYLRAYLTRDAIRDTLTLP